MSKAVLKFALSSERSVVRNIFDLCEIKKKWYIMIYGLNRYTPLDTSAVYISSLHLV